MYALRTLAALAFGFAILAGLACSPQAGGPTLFALGTAAAQALAADRFNAVPARGAMAEVAVAFDRAGQVAAGRVSRSSGSPVNDAAALSAALDLAALRHPADVAGRTVLFKASFDVPVQME